jgi:hypothetical protein
VKILKKDELFRIAKGRTEMKIQAELSGLNRLAQLALTPSSETVENIAHEIVEVVQEGYIEKHSTSQSKKASNKRSPKNCAGETLYEVMESLVKNNSGCKPSELWTHFKTSIEEWSGCTCQALTPGDDMDKWFYEYEDSKGNVKTKPYGKFRKDIAAIKKATK